MREPLASGTRLGRYEIIALVGAGGMGEVYRARDHELGRAVAIKILPAAYIGNPDRLRRFELEMRAAAALNHPNILAVFDVGHEEGMPYLVSELLEGQTLRARLDGGALSLRKGIEFGIQIAEGLAAAHDKGIVHRDLKPENIFVTRDERLKILDFGLAKLVDGDSVTLTAAPQTSAGAVLGTAGYLSPEQAGGLPADHRSDIFSFGAILFEMVMHRRAFARETAAQTLAAVIEDDPVVGVPASSGPSARVMNLVRQCIEKAPERRFQAARDLALVLANELADGSSSQPPLTRPGKPLPTLAVAAASVLLGALVAGGILRTFGTGRAAAIGSATRFAITLPAAMPSSYGSPVAISPDGTQVAIAMTSSDGHQLFLRRLDRDELVPLPGTRGAEFPFFSPDGEWVGFWSENKIRKVSAHGGTAIAVADSPAAPFRGADWGDHGILFAPEALGPLYHVAAATGEVSRATTLDVSRGEYSHRWPQVLPGGRGWLYTALTGAPPAVGVPSAMLHIRATGESHELVRGALYARYLGSGVLLFVRDGQTFIVPFDLDRLKLAGNAEVIDEPIATRAASGATFLSVSRDGTAVFVKGGREDSRTLRWVDRHGIAQPVGGAEPASYTAPRISPDGSRVAVTIAGSLGVGDAWVFDLKSQVLTRVTTDGRSAGQMAWSPDGSRLLITSQRDGPANIYIQAADGGGAAERISPNDNQQFASSWLRDGTTISYVQTDPKTGADLWAMRLTDRSPWPLLVMPATQSGGRVSPDGRWLAYTSNQSGTWEAWIATFRQPGPRWQVSTGGGQEVVWSPDSRELYFRRDTRMMAVPIDAAATPPNGRAATIFEGRYLYEPNNPGIPHYDVGPDGRFVMISSEAGPADQAQIVLNWTQNLAARLTTSR